MSDSKPRSTAHLINMRYRFPPGAKDAQGRALATLDIREVDTHDMETASRVADANKSDPQLEQIAASIMAVNGEPFAIGSVAGWNSIAVEFALRAYAKLNGVPQKVAEELLGAGEVIPAK